LTYDVFLPHKHLNITFKHLNTQQFNKIIASYTINTTSLNKEVIDILQENVLTENINLFTLTVFDFAYILLNTKKNCLSDELVVFFTEDEIQNYGVEEYKTYSITELLKEKEEVLPVPPLTVNVDDITVVCSSPSVRKELEYTVSTQPPFENEEEYIENLLLNTITKYIDEIKINDIVYSFSTYNLNNNYHIVKSLPAKVIKQVIKAIEKIKAPSTRLMTLPVYNNENIKLFEKEVSFSNNFFNY
jgi:hypothetical protein